MIGQQIAAAALSALLALFTGLPARDEIRDQQWHLDFLDIEQAHEISTGAGVTVAVIDSGVDGNHPDLAGSLLSGKDFSVDPRPDALVDDDGHGTAMAGLIAAHGRALGVAPDATILPVIDGLQYALAINYAVEQGATVLCLALAHETASPEERAAVANAIANDVVVVAALGNVPDRPGMYPVTYPGVVGAAGVDQLGDQAEVSIVAPQADLAAPAVDIVSTAPVDILPSGYVRGTGTSDATAIIAGVAALIRSHFPEMSAEEVIHRMTATAQDRGEPGRDNTYGYGIVDPVAALTADVPALEPGTTPSIGHTPFPAGGMRLMAIVATWAGVAVLVIVGLVLARRRRDV